MNYRISQYDPLESIQEVIHKQLFQARVSSENILQRVNLPRAPVREDIRYSNNQLARQELRERFSCNNAENYAYSESRSYLSCNDAESSAWESSAQTESFRSERGSVQSETVASRKSRSTTKAQKVQQQVIVLKQKRSRPVAQQDVPETFAHIIEKPA